MEDAERRAIGISVTATKLTAQTLAKALQAAMRKMEELHRNAQTPQGRQSVKKLMNHRADTSGMDIYKHTRLFDRVARKWNVDYAFRKTGPKQYLLLFKTKQADAMHGCFAEYTKRVMRGDRRPSVREQMRQTAEVTRNRPREREYRREAVHNDR